MKFFRVEPKNRMAEQAHGKYTWRLPAVRCGTCNRHIGERFGYASLDISSKLDEEPYTLRQPGDPRGPRGLASRTEFDRLKDPIQKLLGEEKPLLPGVGFGPFRGTVRHSEKRDFVWVLLQVLLLKESTLEQLKQAGLRITTGPAIIEDSKTSKISPDYQRIAELEIVSCMAIQTLEFTESRSCAECGLSVIKRPERVFLKRSALPERLPLFFVEETASIVASDEFATTVKKLKFNNIAFEPIELV